MDVETDLYAPIKQFLEAQGFVVKGEVNGCDLVAVKGEQMLVVEMKSSFNLTLVLQGIKRQKLTETVYLAVGAPRRQEKRSRRHDIRQLCRRLGLGLITVNPARSSRRVEIECDPEPLLPRRNTHKRTLLLKEFHRRSGDLNIGGSTGRPIITAYREDALRIARLLGQQGPSPIAALRAATGIPKTAGILQRNVYGWFERLGRGVYGLSAKGSGALLCHADLILDQAPPPQGSRPM